MTWTKVLHNESGHPDEGTLPPDESLIQMLRVFDADVKRWYYINGICRHFYDEGEGCLNAIVNAPEDTTLVGDCPIFDDDPTEEGIYWRLSFPTESATVES